MRTAEHLIPVLDAELSLRADTISSKSVGAHRLALPLSVNSAKALAGHYHVYAEVWGSSSSRGAVPVAWVGGMSDLVNGALDIGLDTRWIGKAGAVAPFELRNVRVEDADYFITLAKADRLALNTPSLPKSAARGFAIDNEMLIGPRPASQFASKGVGRKLL
ncbi:MAG: conditioned medium factor, partial [Lysobacterales bacterium CG02_land_8_20_14_3_00_62_12]